MEIVPQLLFPSVVWTTLFDDRVSLNARLLDLAGQLRTNDPLGVQNTNVRGWQSHNNLQT